MAALVDRLTTPTVDVSERTTFASLSLSDWIKLSTSFTFNGLGYTVGGTGRISGDFEALVQNVHSQNNVVAAAVFARSLLLKEITFVWQNIKRQDPMFRQVSGDRRLLKLERPGQLTLPQTLATLEYHESYGGAGFLVDYEGELQVAAPDQMRVNLVGPDDADAVKMRRYSRKVGYTWFREGVDRPEAAVPLTLDEVAHWVPEPHPLYWWTGQSWVLSVLSEVAVDKAASRYVNEFMARAATPSMIVKPHEMLTSEQVDEYADIFAKEYAGAANAGKTMWLGGGSTVEVVGSKIAELDLKGITGGFENRVAVRARIPAAILGIRESLGGSAMQTGNYNSARRMLADGWFQPTVRDLCATLETVMRPDEGERLWYDRADILFLQEDSLDQATILQAQAAAIRQLVDGGFDPATAVRAVKDNNLNALSHTGKLSVQLQPPGEGGVTAE